MVEFPNNGGAMINRLLKNFCPFLFLVLAACASQGGTYVRDMRSIPEGKGVVILSTGAEKTNRLSSTKLVLVNGESHKKYDSVLINFDYPFPSDFDGEHGNLRSITLPEGWYYLYPEVVATRTERAPLYKFYVKRGEVEYIGNLSLRYGKYGREVHFSSAHRFRDVDLFSSKNKAISRNEIKTHYMEFDSEFSAKDPDGFKIKGIIFGQP